MPNRGFFKIFPLAQFLFYEKREKHRVDDWYAEFFDKIENEGRLTIAFTVVEAEIWIKTDVKACPFDFIVKDALTIIQYAVKLVPALWFSARESIEFF